MTDTKKQAKLVRAFRWLHRKIAIPLLVFFFIVSLTGLLLGLKKNTGMLAPTQKGVSADLSRWLSMDSLHRIALAAYRDTIVPGHEGELDRIDVRPDKGIAKFTFKGGYWGVQLDCTTGTVLLVEKRHSDFIEDLHDGSILDNVFSTPGEEVKLVYTTVMGLSLLLLAVSGFWLWYGPKKIRREKRHLK
ncbi:MAG TPA: PepSY domain-containing protein [Chitinophagaceae bacterium]|nr:PepSY domain-containing protein [Chitinophagaceae bacterium]